jgi:hypothetical protein
MNELREGDWSAETSYGTYVGLHHGAPDTIAMIFQRPSSERGTLTTCLPLGIEAFRTLVALGKRMLEQIDGGVK